MKNVGRVTALAVCMVVVLRMAIGWQMFYEGIWKIGTFKTPKPWTAEGYLKNSTGPLRDTFRNLASDPYDLDWLDRDKVCARWDDWQRRFELHYELSKREKARLDQWINGSQEFFSDEGKLVELPPGVELENVKARENSQAKSVQLVRFDPEKQRLVVNGRLRITARDKDKILKMAGLVVQDNNYVWPEEGVEMPENVKAFKEQFEKVCARASQLSAKEKLYANLGNADMKGSESHQLYGEIQKYRHMIEQYESQLAVAKQDFQYAHLAKLAKEIKDQAALVVNPIKAIDKELKDKAIARLTLDQVKQGAVSEPWTALRISDVFTITGLACLGLLLIVGLFTRFAAVMGAVMIFMFYMAMPPLPGLPETVGPEHSFIVNKNLIEVIALLAIATIPTGYWFGLDKLVHRIFSGRKAKKAAAAA